MALKVHTEILKMTQRKKIHGLCPNSLVDTQQGEKKQQQTTCSKQSMVPQRLHQQILIEKKLNIVSRV